MSVILEVNNLSKHFGSLKAVDDISFSIKAGQCFGLLGPNGAGKTTTLEIIEGVKSPSSGSLLYKGQPVKKHLAKEAGIQFQSTALPDYLTARDTLNLFKEFYDDALGIDELIHLCDLEDFIDRTSTKLSGGQRQRLLLAIALINKPNIIFLDEPTTGLDPQSRRHFWTLINNIKRHGKTIILTTHYMDEAQSLCDELVIMDHGKIIAEGRPKDLLARHFETICIALDNIKVCDQRLALFKEQMSDTETGLEIHSTEVDKTIANLIAQQIDLSTLNVRAPTLEDLFIKLTGHSLRS